MKVLLTVPVHCYRQSHPDIPDLGLGYLASALRRFGHEPHVLDWGRRDTEQSFNTFFRTCDPQALGIKTFTKNFTAVRRTIRLIRKLSQTLPIILGGPHASAETPAKLFRDFPGIDYAIRGEGEKSLPLLISALEEGKSIPRVPGLIVPPGSDDSSESACAVFDDKKAYRPAWDLLDPFAYTPVTIGRRIGAKNIVPMIGTRGCPYACTFCSTPLTCGKKIRWRDQEAILDEMAFLAKHYNANQFAFVDMNFTHDPERLMNFCGALGKKGGGLYWNCVASPRFYEYVGPAFLRTMKKAGCTTLVMGIESASNPVRERVGKHPAIERITAAAGWAKQRGIELRGYFMFGFPDETLEEMEETYHYAFSGLFDFLSFDLCFPLPGTEMLRRYLETHKLQELNWDSFTPADPPAPISKVGTRALNSIFRKSRVRAMLKNQGIVRTSLAVFRKISSKGGG